MIYVVEVRGARCEVRIEGNRVWVDGVEHRAELREFGGSPERVLMLDGRSFPLALEPGGRGRWVGYAQGERLDIELIDPRVARARRTAGAVGGGKAHAGAAQLKAPMPGMVVRVLVEPGQVVDAGASLVVLEAMKMENELRAAGPGVVERVLVRAGQTVEKGALLVAFRS